MPRKTGTQNLRTDEVEPRSSLSQSKLERKEEQVSVSFAYYRSQTECLSSWTRADLKCFVRAVEKMRSMRPDQLRDSSLCSVHSSKKPPKRFVRPEEIPDYHRMHKIRVDQSNAARMHGVIDGSVFYLVWLDKNHEAFPSKNGGS